MPKVEAPGHPGHPLPLSDAVVNLGTAILIGYRHTIFVLSLLQKKGFMNVKINILYFVWLVFEACLQFAQFSFFLNQYVAVVCKLEIVLNLTKSVQSGSIFTDHTLAYPKPEEWDIFTLLNNVSGFVCYESQYSTSCFQDS